MKKLFLVISILNKQIYFLHLSYYLEKECFYTMVFSEPKQSKTCLILNERKKKDFFFHKISFAAIFEIVDFPCKFIVFKKQKDFLK